MNRGWGVSPQLRGILIVYVFENISKGMLQRFRDLKMKKLGIGAKKCPPTHLKNRRRAKFVFYGEVFQSFDLAFIKSLRISR